MIDAVLDLACAITALGTGYRLWSARGGRSGPGTYHLLAFMLCLGASLPLWGPAVSDAAQDSQTLGRWLPLAGDELRLAAECFLALLAYSVGDAGARRSRVRRQAAGSALVMVASAVAYLACAATLAGGELVTANGDRISLTVYNSLFTAHGLWCVGVFAFVMHRSARLLGPGLLRIGLRLVVAGALMGLAWTAEGITPVLAGLTTGRQINAETGFSALTAVLALALGIGGMTLTAWGAYAARPVRWLRAWRGYRRIGPLWTALHDASPQIALEAAIGRAGSRILPWDAEFALYRRVIEIRDGRLALRPHLHPLAGGWAVAACADRPGERRRAATVEAAVIAAALEAAASGRRYEGGTVEGEPELGGPKAGDLAAETAWLILVSGALTGSAVVAAVRRQVRTELEAGTGGREGQWSTF